MGRDPAQSEIGLGGDLVGGRKEKEGTAEGEWGRGDGGRRGGRMERGRGRKEGTKKEEEAGWMRGWKE